MRRLSVLVVCAFILALTSTTATAQISYCKDALEDGNPGGWTEGLKTFEDEWSMSTGGTVDVDIWLNDLPEDPLTAGFFINYNPALVTITNVVPYDSDNGGPWDNGFTHSFEVVPGQWFLVLADFACVAPDGDGDVILGKVTFERQGPGDANVTISTIPDFETVTGCSPGAFFDSQITPNIISITQSCSIDANCDDGISCTDDACVSGLCESILNDTNCSDDGLYCNGYEVCDFSNDCISTGDPCTPAEVCNEGIDQCIELPPCSVAIIPSSATVFTWESVQFSTTLDGTCNEPCFTWEIPVQGSTGSTISQTGLYTAGGNGGTNIVQVTDPCNRNIADNAIVNVIVPCIPDSYEPDDIPPAANPIDPDSCQLHSICPIGDRDWVTFELTSESGVILETFGQEGDSVICLYDNNLNTIMCDDDGGPGLWSYIEHPCLPAGTYYLEIRGFGDGWEIPEYEICLSLIPCPPPVELDCSKLLASSHNGELFRIDITTGETEFIGSMFPYPLATEIEYDTLSGTLYAEEVNGYQNLHTLDPERGISLGFVTHEYDSLNGLEFVDSILYGTFKSGCCGPPSELVIVDTSTGDLTHVGPTGFGPISGLAYDKGTGVMYGVTAGGAPAELVTIDLNTGAATVIGPTGLDRIGSIEFGPDGNLYGGVTAGGSSLATYLVRIDTATGAATPIGETGYSITGLTSCQEIADIIFDIKPDPLNLKCKGVMPAAIVGTDKFDVTSIDPDSLKLTRDGIISGVAPIRYSYTDGEMGDMLLKFKVPEVVEGLMLDELAGQTISLTITGETEDGVFIQGQDSVRLLGNIVQECTSDLDCDADVDGSDAWTFKQDFGRSSIQNPCSDEYPCDGDFDKDSDVDGNDAFMFKSDYGKILYYPGIR